MVTWKGGECLDDDGDPGGNMLATIMICHMIGYAEAKLVKPSSIDMRTYHRVGPHILLEARKQNKDTVSSYLWNQSNWL
jgi:hypothetical protein